MVAVKKSEKQLSLHLIVQLYGSQDDIHFKRMLECIQENAQFDFVKMVTVVCDLGIITPPIGDKIRVLFSDTRGSYSSLMRCNLPSIEGLDTTHYALANSDILLSDSIYKCMENITHASHVAAISRTEMNGRLVKNPECSQDLWLFKSHKPDPQLLEAAWYLLGIAGCENLYAMSLWAHGYSIWNPCLDCSVFHNDPSPKITWDERYFGSYLYLKPCRTEEIAAEPPVYGQVFSRREKFIETPTDRAA